MNGAKGGRRKTKTHTRTHQSRHSSLSSRCARVSMVLLASRGPRALSAPAASPQSWCRSPSIACRSPRGGLQHSRRACIRCHCQDRHVETRRLARRAGIDTGQRSPPLPQWQDKARTSKMLLSCCCASESTQKSPSHAVPPPRPSASSSSSSGADDARLLTMSTLPLRFLQEAYGAGRLGAAGNGKGWCTSGGRRTVGQAVKTRAARHAGAPGEFAPWQAWARSVQRDAVGDSRRREVREQYEQDRLGCCEPVCVAER
jgi:hypothetical protein